MIWMQMSSYENVNNDNEILVVIAAAIAAMEPGLATGWSRSMRQIPQTSPVGILQAGSSVSAAIEFII